VARGPTDDRCRGVRAHDLHRRAGAAAVPGGGRPRPQVDAIGIARRPADLPAPVAAHAAAFDHLNLCAPPRGLDADAMEAATEAILAAR
jgi:hypothetical protein